VLIIRALLRVGAYGTLFGGISSVEIIRFFR
jgi:hypothetical protein